MEVLETTEGGYKALLWLAVRESNFILAERMYLWPWVKTRHSDVLQRLEHFMSLSPPLS